MRGAPVPTESRPPGRPSSLRFAETVRAVVTAARRRGLRPPVFRSPPRVPGADRTIRRTPDGGAVVAVRVAGRPFAAVQADVVEGVVVANRLDVATADRFRRAAWHELDRLVPAEAAPVPPVGAVRVVAPGVPGVTPWDAPAPAAPDPDGPAAPRVA